MASFDSFVQTCYAVVTLMLLIAGCSHATLTTSGSCAKYALENVCVPISDAPVLAIAPNTQEQSDIESNFIDGSIKSYTTAGSACATAASNFLPALNFQRCTTNLYEGEILTYYSPPCRGLCLAYIDACTTYELERMTGSGYLSTSSDCNHLETDCECVRGLFPGDVTPLCDKNLPPPAPDGPQTSGAGSGVSLSNRIGETVLVFAVCYAAVSIAEMF